MKPLLFVFTLIAAISLLASPGAAESRPNILLEMVDDMGYSDIDPGETTNLAAQHRERVQSPARLFDAWAKRVGVVPRERIVKLMK